MLSFTTQPSRCRSRWSIQLPLCYINGYVIVLNGRQTCQICVRQFVFRRHLTSLVFSIQKKWLHSEELSLIAHCRQHYFQYITLPPNNKNSEIKRVRNEHALILKRLFKYFQHLMTTSYRKKIIQKYKFIRTYSQVSKLVSHVQGRTQDLRRKRDKDNCVIRNITVGTTAQCKLQNI